MLGTTSARDLFVRELARVRREYGFLLVGYVVMPEHVHLLMGEPQKGDPSTVLKMLKQRVSWKLRRERRGAANSPLQTRSTGFEVEKLRRFWQARFYDSNVYSGKKKREKLEYMHANPVTRGLVEHPRDWPWSSWANYSNSSEVLVTIDPR